MRGINRLWIVIDKQGQFQEWEVFEETETQAKIQYCKYMNINPLLYSDRLVVVPKVNNGRDLLKKMQDTTLQW